MTLHHGSTRRVRSVRVGVMSAAALTLALGGLPMAATIPAQAVSPGRCEVDANRPADAGGGYYAYSFEFDCPRGYRVRVQQTMYEEDRGPDQKTSGPYTYQHRFNSNAEWKKSSRARVLDTEYGDEEVYHVVRWREYDRRGNGSRWFSARSRTATP